MLGTVKRGDWDSSGWSGNRSVGETRDLRVCFHLWVGSITKSLVTRDINRVQGDIDETRALESWARRDTERVTPYCKIGRRKCKIPLCSR